MSAFAGIGMGAIQAGLFLPRAQEAGMRRTVLVRRREQAKRAASSSRLCVNVAHSDGLSTLELTDVGAVALADPGCCDVLTAAAEIAVAVPSVEDYAGLAPLLAEATRRKDAGLGPKCLFYACQNEPAAAEALKNAVIGSGGSDQMFQTLDTVIGKMSRTIRDADEAALLGLVPGASGMDESWLVEEYDDIYISKPDASLGFQRRLPRLTECDDLRPFEISKLNGHNAAHSALAYAGQLLGCGRISDVMACMPVRDLVTEAFLHETGAVLRKRFGNRNPLFTENGWERHADGLFARMASPWLRDDCRRVGRNPERKLGWNDRLIGTVRLIEAAGCRAERWRVAARCAAEACGFTEDSLARLWRGAGARGAEVDAMLRGQRDLSSSYAAWRNEISACCNSRNI